MGSASLIALEDGQVTFRGKNYATDLTISGDKLYAPNGIPVVRIR